jgi:hypothetical protein
MAPYNKNKKLNDVERPISTNILGRDVLGINASIPVLSKTTSDLQDAELSIDYTNKIK